jgi:hypothetical protein
MKYHVLVHDVYFLFSCSFWLAILIFLKGFIMQYFNILLSLVRRYDNATTCGLVWTANFVAYRCRTCGISPCMSLCSDCFKSGNHDGHDFNMFRSQAGGACDCGDTSVMKDTGWVLWHNSFCNMSEHSGFRHDIFISILNVVVAWTLHLFYILEILGPDLGVKTGYPAECFWLRDKLSCWRFLIADCIWIVFEIGLWPLCYTSLKFIR